MQSKNCICLGIKSVLGDDLIRYYPPKYSCKRKMQIYKQAKKLFRHRVVTMTISRWKSISLGSAIMNEENINNLKIQRCDDFFSYDDHDDKYKRVWYLNYADPYLFKYYGSDLFAQDEIQTLEHPLLGSVVEYLNANHFDYMASRTFEVGIPTPYLIEQVPHWINVQTDVVLENGEHKSLYGHNMAEASVEVFNKGVCVCKKANDDNIIAISAPQNGHGVYTSKQINQIVETLVSSFSAAVYRNQDSEGRERTTTIHSGEWGCGVFGGNKILLFASQMICASIAGVDSLILHTKDEISVVKAQELYNFICSKHIQSAADAVTTLFTQHFEWGIVENN